MYLASTLDDIDLHQNQKSQKSDPTSSSSLSNGEETEQTCFENLKCTHQSYSNQFIDPNSPTVSIEYDYTPNQRVSFRRFLSKIEDINAPNTFSQIEKHQNVINFHSKKRKLFNRYERGSKTLIINTLPTLFSELSKSNAQNKEEQDESSFLDSASIRQPLNKCNSNLLKYPKDEIFVHSRFHKEKKLLDLEHRLRKKNINDTTTTKTSNFQEKVIKNLLFIIFVLLTIATIGITIYPLS